VPLFALKKTGTCVPDNLFGDGSPGANLVMADQP
jgi:hypothetical protein